ncbi:MAG: hypothetical protein WAV11_03075 [Minisyncoccia bacterium]
MMALGQSANFNGTSSDTMIESVKSSANQISSYNQVDIIINPRTPKAGDLVTAEVSATGWDFNQAKVTWTINKEQLASDYGLKKVSFNLGKGSVIIQVNVLGADGRKGNGVAEIKPNEVVVIWEASTYTPPFYRGKALAPAGSVFRVIAIPNIKNSSGVKVASDKLVYKWKKNDKVSQDYSGYGKDVFYTLDETYVRDGNNINAEIYTTDNSAYYQTEVYVPHQENSLFIYKIDPLLGRLYNNVVGSSLNYSDTFIKLIAEPYFFSNISGNQEVEYSWSVRGEKISFNKQIIELKSADGGEISLDLNVKHNTKILQYATAQTRVIPQQVTSLEANTF